MELLYKSTRGNNQVVSASKAIIKGIANDGGLFVPTEIPKLSCSLNELSNMNYKEVAYEVMKLFFTDFTDQELKNCIDNAYNDKFDTELIAPLQHKSQAYFLELFHGPTIAFKDMALSILPYLMKTAIKKQNIDKEIVILTATSGDTGKAALEGFAGVDGTSIIVFYPKDGVSPIQEKQMITQKGKNTYVVAIEGNFDDAQNGVKEIFADDDFNKKINNQGYQFSSANSINIGRLVPQIVYYFYAYSRLIRSQDIKCDERINICVPTGNFGNILAAYYAKNMGLPVNKLLCASNDNKVLFDFMKTGTYNKNRKFMTTISPSMDILISSNLERLLYIISGNSDIIVSDIMNQLNNKGKYNITDDMKNNLDDFYGNYATQQDTLDAIQEVFNQSKYLIDTHTAVGYSVYSKYKQETNDDTKTIIASTASPYKFTKSVMRAINNEYTNYDDFELINKMNNITDVPIPNAVISILDAPIRHNNVCKKDEMRKTILNLLQK